MSKLRLVNTRQTREQMFQNTTFGKTYGKTYTETKYQIQRKFPFSWDTEWTFWKSSVDEALEYFNEYVTEEKRKYEESQLESIIIAEAEF